MKLRYIDVIKTLPPNIQEAIIKEAPHTLVVEPIPESLAFLRGDFVDLGFENLGLPEQEAGVVYEAFLGAGVGLPGLGFKLRYTKVGVTVVEPISTGEALVMLPSYWAEAVLVINKIGYPLYVGGRVRSNQLG